MWAMSATCGLPDTHPGWGVRWDAGETHTSGTEAGLIALAVEGGPLDLFEPESRERS